MKQVLIAGALLLATSLAGCSHSEPVDTASGKYGKAGDATSLPPQGKPPAPGEDITARARGAAPRP